MIYLSVCLQMILTHTHPLPRCSLLLLVISITDHIIPNIYSIHTLFEAACPLPPKREREEGRLLLAPVSDIPLHTQVRRKAFKCKKNQCVFSNLSIIVLCFISLPVLSIWAALGLIQEEMTCSSFYSYIASSQCFYL